MRLDDELVLWFRKARSAYLAGDQSSADYWHRAIRREHGCELYPAVNLPEHLLLVHPLGTVLGRATYADYFCAYQNVGVGSDLDGNRPVFKGPCVMFPGSKVLGKTVIGANCFILANTVVERVTVPDNSIVYSRPVDAYDPSRNREVNFITAGWRPTKRSVIRDVFKVV